MNLFLCVQRRTGSEGESVSYSYANCSPRFLFWPTRYGCVPGTSKANPRRRTTHLYNNIYLYMMQAELSTSQGIVL